MPRTILIADADEASRELLARTAHEAGYRVLKARTPAEAVAALDGCPISGVAIDEDLLRLCDLRRLLLHAPVLVLSKEDGPAVALDVPVVHKGAQPSELARALRALTGDPMFPGPRAIVPLPMVGTDSGKTSPGNA